MNSYGLNGHQRMPQCQIVGDKKYCHKKAEKKLTKEQIYEHWKNGDSFILTLCEFLNKTMWQQCVEFEKHFGRGQANIYCSSQKMQVLSYSCRYHRELFVSCSWQDSLVYHERIRVGLPTRRRDSTKSSRLR